MQADGSHQPLWMIELIAQGRAERCPGKACPYWENGCILGRIEADLDGRSDVAELLLAVRHRLEETEAEQKVKGDALAHFHRRLSAGRE